MSACKFCNHGFFDGRFGQDVECVNGVLIDIDEAYEGHAHDVVRPVAPCHPMWERQLADPDGDWPNDSIERLNAWASSQPAADDPCPDCGGFGEYFGHADDCHNDSCALNGDIDSCNGQVFACHCAQGDIA